MTVKELIAILETKDQESEVYFGDTTAFELVQYIHEVNIGDAFIFDKESQAMLPQKEAEHNCIILSNELE